MTWANCLLCSVISQSAVIRGSCGSVPSLQADQVRDVRFDPAEKLRGIADGAMPGNDPDNGQCSQAVQASQVVTDRIGLVEIEQRHLDVGAHVAGDERSAVGQEDRAVAWRMPLMRHHHRLGAVPGRCVRGRAGAG